MAQDTNSGRDAGKWGRETAGRLAKALGATGFGGRTNECALGAKRVVIKCAARKTTTVGVTPAMLDRLDTVIAAFETDDESFELWELTVAQYRSTMRDSAGAEKPPGMTGQVARTAFEKDGKSLGRVKL